MEPSPLIQQGRPSIFQPKIDRLYEQLLSTDENDQFQSSDGFWQEFFLLRPDKSSLQRRLEWTSADDLLHLQNRTQQLFRRAAGQINSRNGTSDGAALDTLTVFLDTVLAKRYTNPSSEIITVLAGLDEVDDIFFDFANAVENVIRTGGAGMFDEHIPSTSGCCIDSIAVSIRRKAVEVAIALTAGAYQTSLVSYFTHRDLFPCLIKYIQDLDTPSHIFEPFLLLGLLANYNKFEFRNPYRSRLEDFVNEAAIQQIIRGFGAVCSRSRDNYVAIQEDIEEGWTLSSTLKYIGLGVLAPSRSSTPTPNPPSNTEDTKDPFAILPDTNAAILLPAYDFTNANQLYRLNLLTHPSYTPKSETPFSAFLSLTSYTLHHAHRSSRASLYGLLSLITLRILTEDATICPKLFSPALSTPVRLCRQRAPSLPATPSPRPLAASILDIAIDTITHNLRRRLDIPLYTAALHILHRLLSHLASTRTRFPGYYHWPLLWQTLLSSLLRFLATYAALLVTDPGLPALLDVFLAVLGLAVAAGDVFLPDAAAHDDFFYKLVESAHLFPKFRTGFASLLMKPSPSPSARASTMMPSSTSPHPDVHYSSSSSSFSSAAAAATAAAARLDALMATAAYFERLLEEESSKGGGGNKQQQQQQQQLGPKEVGRVIRRGVEGLRVPEGMEGVERWERWREGDERGMVKKVGRKAVEDARRVVREQW